MKGYGKGGMSGAKTKKAPTKAEQTKRAKASMTPKKGVGKRVVMGKK